MIDVLTFCTRYFNWQRNSWASTREFRPKFYRKYLRRFSDFNTTNFNVFTHVADFFFFFFFIARFSFTACPCLLLFFFHLDTLFTVFFFFFSTSTIASFCSETFFTIGGAGRGSSIHKTLGEISFRLGGVDNTYLKMCRSYNNC